MTTQAAEKTTPEEKTKTAEGPHVVPLKAGAFGLARHRYQEFSALVPAGTTKAEMEDPRFWAHVARDMAVGSEIRILSEDMSFRAAAVVTFAHSHSVRVQVYAMDKLAAVDVEEATQSDLFEVMLKGPKRWCVIDKASGQAIFSNIATRSEAYAKLDDHLKMLNA